MMRESCYLNAGPGLTVEISPTRLNMNYRLQTSWTRQLHLCNCAVSSMSKIGVNTTANMEIRYSINIQIMDHLIRIIGRWIKIQYYLWKLLMKRIKEIGTP